MEERLSKLGRMTRKVTASNPQEGRQVQARHSEITGLWDKLKVSEILYCYYLICVGSGLVHDIVRLVIELILCFFRLKQQIGRLSWTMHSSYKPSLLTPEIL